MKFDLVHDLQHVYRKMLKSMSRPGLIENIGYESSRVNGFNNIYDGTVVIMQLLLDTETSFNIISNVEEEIISYISQLTYGKTTSTKEADFLFVLKDAFPCKIESAITDSKIGNLVDPHKSSTIVIEVESITRGKELILKGPGIEKENTISIKCDFDWISARESKNIEYPLGIDIIFIDKSSNIMCLPRTTQIIRQVVK